MARRKKLSGLADVDCEPVYSQLNKKLRLSPTQCKLFPAGKTLLGSGYFATVYEHAEDPTKVVKFTTDVDDILASAMVKATNPAGVVKVYEIAELSNVRVNPNRANNPADDERIYGIVAERVTPLKEARPDLVEVADTFRKTVQRATTRSRRAGEFLNPGPDFKWPDAFTADALTECETVLSSATPPWNTDGSRAPRTTSRTDAKEACAVIPKMIGAMTALARKSGVFTPDVHSGNWGFRDDGKLVLIDLGVGRTNPDMLKPVPALAKAPKRRRMASRRRVR